jgi:hypothetical protein
VTSTAKAHLLKRTKHETKLHYANRLIWHGKTALKWIKTHKRFVLATVGPDPYRVQVRDHRWELRYGLRLKREQLRRIYYSSLPAHYRGWICIHNREGAWNSNTGNGYYGGLQATYGWFGVSRMDLLSPLAQMRHAENVARSNGFSYSFMKGQWPNTFPPCANYF